MNRQDLLFMANLAQNAERFEDMLHFMTKILSFDSFPTKEEKMHLFLAYKCVVASRRNAIRNLTNQQDKEREDPKKLKLIKQYKHKIEAELTRYCNELLNIIDSQLLPKAPDAEYQISCLKTKADYYRYIAEYAVGPEQAQAMNCAHETYKIAMTKAQQQLKVSSPWRLGLALNYSVFLYEIKSDVKGAQKLSKKAFEAALEQIDTLEEDQYQDTTIILQLLRDSLTLWISEQTEDL